MYRLQFQSTTTSPLPKLSHRPKASQKKLAIKQYIKVGMRTTITRILLDSPNHKAGVPRSIHQWPP